MESIWYCCNKPISHLDFSLSKSPKVKVDCLRLRDDLSTWERRDPFDGNLPEVDSRAGRPTCVSKWWVKLIAFVCQHIYIPGCALMERLWVEGYWSPSRLPSGGLGGSCVAPHNLITSYHRSQHIDSNLDNNLNNILDNNVYMCKNTFTRRLSRARFTRSLTASTFSVIMFFSVVSTSCAQFNQFSSRYLEQYHLDCWSHMWRRGSVFLCLSNLDFNKKEVRRSC